MYADQKQNQQSGSYRGNSNRKSWPRMNPKNQRRTGSSAFLDRDGDTDMSAGGSSSFGGGRGRHKNRYNPGYGRHMNRNKPHLSGWWKIVVHDADKFDKDDFFKMLDNTTNESIDPQSTRVERNKLIFWIKNTRAKEAIYNQSGKLTLKDHTITMFAVPSEGPEAQLTKDEKKGKVCNALVKRYIVEEKKLNLSELYKDPDLVGMSSKLFEIAPILSELITEKCADVVQEIDFSNNSLRHAGCLREILSACKVITKIKLDNNRINSLTGIKTVEKNASGITHLSLLNNPVKNLMDDAQYISDIRKLFPKLIELDGVALPEKIKFETEEQSVLPQTQKFAILLEAAPKKAIQNFFLQYVNFHDAGSAARTQLGPAYDETCLFSISVAWRANKDIKDKCPAVMPSELTKKNRNFKHCYKAEQKESRLFIGRENVVKELCTLGETKHMMHTMNIDTSGMFNNHVTAVLSGIIDAPGSYRTFSRTFVVAANPANGSFLILNDQMSIVRSSPDTVEKVLKQSFDSTPSPSGVNNQAALVKQSFDSTPSYSGVNSQAALVKQVQQATRMTDQFCTHCLVAANWDFQKALELFNDKKASIPPDAFLK